jgi:hypothetical protein
MRVAVTALRAFAGIAARGAGGWTSRRWWAQCRHGRDAAFWLRDEA